MLNPPKPMPSPSGGKGKRCDDKSMLGVEHSPRLVGPRVGSPGAAGIIILIISGIVALWLNSDPKPPRKDNPFAPKSSSCPEPGFIDKGKCRRAIKILEQYERLAKDRGIKIPPDRLKRLNELRDSGEIRITDLPGGLRGEFPGEFDGDTLDRIRKKCREK